MKSVFTAAAAILAFAAVPLSAQEFSGDPDAGEGVFRQCQSCHVVVNEAGETLAGRNAQTGPNLYGISGRTAGTVEDFDKYSDAMVEAGEAGLEWTEENFVAYVNDPTGYLREVTGDNRARSNMNHRLRGSAEDLYAYLAQFGPE